MCSHGLKYISGVPLCFRRHFTSSACSQSLPEASPAHSPPPCSSSCFPHPLVPPQFLKYPQFSLVARPWPGFFLHQLCSPFSFPLLLPPPLLSICSERTPRPQRAPAPRSPFVVLRYLSHLPNVCRHCWSVTCVKAGTMAVLFMTPSPTLDMVSGTNTQQIIANSTEHLRGYYWCRGRWG